MEAIWERSREIGRLLAQSDEYHALKRANARLAEDQGTVTTLNRLNELQESFTVALQNGQEPPQEQQEEYERLVGTVQTSATYQGFESARANFDRMMMRVQEEIARGIEAGEQSRIILPT